MSLGHFQYLLSGDGPQRTKVASDRLELLAKTAAKRYLEERTPLNDSIRKIAEENDLNRNQIERVCEMANIATHQGLWAKTAQKESVAFDVADSKKIVMAVKPTEEAATPEAPSCPASVDADYMGPPKGVPSAGPSLLSLMGADPENSHQGLHQEPEKKRIIIILQKKAAEKSDQESKVLYKGMELETLEKKAFEAVKQEVLGGTSFRTLYIATAAAGLSKIAAEYFPKWEQRLIAEAYGSTQERLTKEAILKAPTDLISGDMGNIAVANGAHPVMVSLDTVQRKTGEIKQGLHNLLRIGDEVKVYTQRLRELS